MRRIVGLVQVRETGLGVPNLVVTVFDSECPPEDIRRHQEPALVLRGAGRRLSSVLTGQDGRFMLPTDDLEFAGNEPRPNLMLVVFAPEDVQDPLRPFPLPPEQRVLYASTMPRSDVGAEEAYVIRLLQVQIDHFQIAVEPHGRSTGSAIRDLADPILRAWALRDGMREQLGERMRAEQERLAKARADAKTKLQHFSALPSYLRSAAAQNDALVIRGKAQLLESVPRLQEKAVTDGIGRFKKVATALKPTVQLRLSQQEIDDLGLTVKDGKITGKISAADLAKKLRSTMNVLDLVRVRELDPPDVDELASKYLTSDQAPAPRNRKNGKPK